MTTTIPRYELLHHGAAANSSPKAIACLPNTGGDILQGRDEECGAGSEVGTTELIYASHLMLNVAKPMKLFVGNAKDSGDETNAVKNHEKIWNVEQTLRTSTSLTAEEVETAAANVSTRTAKRVITCVVQLKWLSHQDSAKNRNRDDVLVCGFSDGSLTSWYRPCGSKDWEEYVLLSHSEGSKHKHFSSDENSNKDDVTEMKGRSITDIDGYVIYGNHDDEEKQTLNLSIVTCSSGGAQYFQFSLLLSINGRNDGASTWRQRKEPQYAAIKDTKNVIGTPSNTVKFHTIVSSEGEKSTRYTIDGKQNILGIFLVGTAAPRHNKIHVLVLPPTVQENDIPAAPKYSGSLTGHEDWITCFDWNTNFELTFVHKANDGESGAIPTVDCCYLASGSQDAKIRLWKWVTTTCKVEDEIAFSDRQIGDSQASIKEQGISSIDESGDGDRNVDVADDDDDDDEEEVIEGEARLEIQHYGCSEKNLLKTSVYLEALLIGHEEMVTSVAWHPNPKALYDEEMILVSSSMDRSIFIWSVTDDGVWTPISRVGSPCGILGGPVGASLLGYLNIQIEPHFGRWIMGHAYGGALHFFSCERNTEDRNLNVESSEQSHMSIEERAALVKWKAQPCITGHFDEVTDLCWEAIKGEYLITVSNDATCRQWAPITKLLDAWIEISRPQVHGYTLSAVTSLSTPDHEYQLVTGADEKELRAFDGTKSFLRMLRLISEARGETNCGATRNDISRVDRAYMPSLGLSNKDSAADGADEDTAGASTTSTLLPIEKDLGSTSLWPEVRKLYGHNSEIARLTSTLSARTCLSTQYSTSYFNQVLVASTTKARDVNTAAIRLWDINANRCLQNLQGGHRSTVTALSFSPDGTYLASSGKDRRLCVWKRRTDDNTSAQNELFFLASAVNSSHKRIVWSVHFCPHNPTTLASGSRDGTIKLWKITEGAGQGDQNTTVVEYSKFVPSVDVDTGHASKDKPEAVTSLAFSPCKFNNQNNGVIAIGLENGLIQLWSVPIIPSLDGNVVERPSTLALFDAHFCHIGAIWKLAWRPRRDDEIGPFVLASCSSDNGCRIFSVWLHNE